MSYRRYWSRFWSRCCPRCCWSGRTPAGSDTFVSAVGRQYHRSKSRCPRLTTGSIQLLNIIVLYNQIIHMLLYIVTNLRWKNIITRPRQILSHNCPARGGQLCDKSSWKRSTCSSWFWVTSLVAFLTGKWPPIYGCSSKKYSFWDER